ncbi:MAG TPA: preprotein translocase subunit SecA [Candidatus Paceibacterota bacterium]
MSFLEKIFGSASERFVKEVEPIVAKINAFEPQIEKLSDEELKAKTKEFKELLENGKTLEDLLPEAFACVREAARRTLGQRHFDVQMLGGIAMHRGGIAEMRTGEGKTLVATLPAYLNALIDSMHVVTVNDYLSMRDAAWMGQIYNALGLTVAVISHDSSFLYDESWSSSVKASADEERDEKGSFKVVHEFLRPIERVEAYEADITYGTNSEFGFDYLRDNLEYTYEKVRQKKHPYAIVDEIDSILIDEARTPLIISAPSADSDEMYKKFAGLAAKLKQDEHYTLDEKMHAVLLTDDGISKAEELLGIQNIYAGGAGSTEGGIKTVHHLETAIKAKALYHKDKEYVVKDGEVVIVDPYTGRLQPGRRWSEGLHQAIEAKEGVNIQKESRTFASITYQNYFRMYKKLSGMTGTAMTSQEEFYKVYGLNTVSIPTNNPIKRIDRDDLIFQTEKGKLMAIAKKVKELQSNGQPVLIGTISIEKNELLGEYLKREGVKFEMLNAKNHEREGEIIAQAGRKGAVTVATNMAGRGVDIKLGGSPASDEEADFVREVGGLFVLGTERHDARRIDNQLRGRSGRQGDPGETQFFVSMEDHIMRVFAADTVKNMMGRLGIPEDEAIQNKLITRSLESAQGKIEGLNFDARKHVLEYDDVLNFQRKTFYERRRGVLENEKDGQVRQVKLQVYDMFWVEHLETMDHLRSSVNLRAYGQRDPLVEYKREGLRLFKEMEESIKNTVEENLKKLEENKITMSAMGDVQRQAELITTSADSNNHPSPPYTKGGTRPDTSDPKYKNVGRNDPCPCGSGKKFKKCHGAGI